MTTRYFHVPEDMEFNAAPAQASPLGPLEAVSKGGVVRHQVTHSGTPGGSIAATLSGTFGKPSVELMPGDPSSRTSVEAAARQGLLRHDGQQWVDVIGSDGKAVSLEVDEQPQAEPQDPGAGVFDPEDDALWSEDIAPLDQHAHDAALASMVNVIAHGTGSFQDAAKALATNAGIEPSLAADYVEQGTAMFQGVVDRALAQDGLTGERLQRAYQYMRTKPAALQQALQGLLHGRDVSGFRRLAADFISNTPA